MFTVSSHACRTVKYPGRRLLEEETREGGWTGRRAVQRRSKPGANAVQRPHPWSVSEDPGRPFHQKIGLQEPGALHPVSTFAKAHLARHYLTTAPAHPRPARRIFFCFTFALQAVVPVCLICTAWVQLCHVLGPPPQPEY